MPLSRVKLQRQRLRSKSINTHNLETALSKIIAPSAGPSDLSSVELHLNSMKLHSDPRMCRTYVFWNHEMAETQLTMFTQTCSCYGDW